jgi:acyl carrier protein/gas vesicle protein
MGREIYELNNVDPKNIDDVILKIQRSFNIKFDSEGLKGINTFGGLCDLIVSKINHENEDSCTTQHAFYLLRNVIAATAGIDKCDITPQTRLSKIFPRESRLQMISEIENELGFSVNLLQPKQWVLILFSLIFIGSLIGCYFNWQIGVAGILASVTALRLAGKFGKEMHLKTVGDMANKVARESYLKSRRNSCTVNKNEIEQKVRELFKNDLDLKPVALRRESNFN